MDAKEFRRIGHRVVDELAHYFETIGERPVFPDVAPAEVSALFAELASTE